MSRFAGAIRRCNNQVLASRLLVLIQNTAHARYLASWHHKVLNVELAEKCGRSYHQTDTTFERAFVVTRGRGQTINRSVEVISGMPWSQAQHSNVWTMHRTECTVHDVAWLIKNNLIGYGTLPCIKPENE
eukprot:scaffold273777_cov39-Tisochrysis_lutea.AAC.1